MRIPALDGDSQGRPLPQHMLLPHQLIETPRPHPHRQRRVASRNLSLSGHTRVKQSIGHCG